MMIVFVVLPILILRVFLVCFYGEGAFLFAEIDGLFQILESTFLDSAFSRFFRLWENPSNFNGTPKGKAEKEAQKSCCQKG